MKRYTGLESFCGDRHLVVYLCITPKNAKYLLPPGTTPGAPPLALTALLAQVPLTFPALTSQNHLRPNQEAHPTSRIKTICQLAGWPGAQRSRHGLLCARTLHT